VKVVIVLHMLENVIQWNTLINEDAAISQEEKLLLSVYTTLLSTALDLVGI